MLFPEQGEDSGFDVIKGFFDASSEDRLRSSLSSIHDAVKPRLLTMTFTTAAIGPKQLMAVWSPLLQGDSEGPSFISRTA
jgi:hypothetical protein